jgi:3',5'-cyclic AMP phosphodiesterase CpdA
MKLLHISDLHLGTHTKDIADALIAAVDETGPDRVVISGDFTQIGSTKEYRAARQLLDRLEVPFFAVPGNHDISRFNLWQRFTSPYKNYLQFICNDLNPVKETDSMLMVGINSARRILPHWNWANGAVSPWQREKIESLFSPDSKRWQILVMHHPVHKIDEMPLDVTVFGRKRTLEAIDKSGIDLVLTGHVHHASFTLMGKENKTVYLSASTTLSRRVRKQENGFNAIELEGNELKATSYIYSGNRFDIKDSFVYKREQSLN